MAKFRLFRHLVIKFFYLRSGASPRQPSARLIFDIVGPRRRRLATATLAAAAGGGAIRDIHVCHALARQKSRYSEFYFVASEWGISRATSGI